MAHAVLNGEFSWWVLSLVHDACFAVAVELIFSAVAPIVPSVCLPCSYPQPEEESAPAGKESWCSFGSSGAGRGPRGGIILEPAAAVQRSYRAEAEAEKSRVVVLEVCMNRYSSWFTSRRVEARLSITPSYLWLCKGKPRKNIEFSSARRARPYLVSFLAYLSMPNVSFST